MGTSADEISLLQAELRKELEKAGLTLRKFAEWYVFHVYDSENENQIRKFQNTLKRQLNRPSSTSGMKAKLDGYLRLLCENEDYRKKVGLLPARLIKYPETDDNFRRGMARISAKIDDAIAEDIDEDCD